MADNYNTIIDQGSDWYRNFLYTQPATITNVSGNGTTVTYTADNGFSAGQTVFIQGILPSQYNLGNVTIASRTSTQFTVTNPATGLYIQGGTALSAVDLTNYTAEMQLRSLPSSPIVVLTLNTANGITIDGPTGTIAVHATATQTAAIVAGPYYYDLEITSPTNVKTRIVQGELNVNAEVTR
ncbi:hypothetical protein EBZ39_08690 [bacterium]|nr:hypothetical protein [bacterium]